MQKEPTKILEELGAKPSISEENGLALLRNTDLMVFSPGISSGGFAEIRMALANGQRKIIATTIDSEGLGLARENITELKLNFQIEMKVEDLTKDFPYTEEYFDYIYARLVLHYLSSQELDKVLANFKRSLKKQGHIFVVVRSEKDVDKTRPDYNFDPVKKLTKVYYRDDNRNIIGTSARYFHTPKSITKHLAQAGFSIGHVKEYEEQLYKDFMRTKVASRVNHLIEIHAFS